MTNLPEPPIPSTLIQELLNEAKFMDKAGKQAIERAIAIIRKHEAEPQYERLVADEQAAYECHKHASGYSDNGGDPEKSGIACVAAPAMVVADAVAEKSCLPSTNTSEISIHKATLEDIIRGRFQVLGYENPVTLARESMLAIGPYLRTKDPVIDKALVNAAEILANFKAGEAHEDGSLGRKLEEWQACYAMLFKQMNELVTGVPEPVLSAPKQHLNQAEIAIVIAEFMHLDEDDRGIQGAASRIAELIYGN
ncbi:hypothetical protein ACYOEI_01090 [Singulisphaera rosea]